MDSSFELRVADRLVAEGRKFRKPLRLEREAYLPDYVLMDCETDVEMEIFGVQGNPEYDAHRAEKLAYYQEKRIPCWHWTPVDEKEMTEFQSSQGLPFSYRQSRAASDSTRRTTAKSRVIVPAIIPAASRSLINSSSTPAWTCFSFRIPSKITSRNHLL